MTPVSSHGSVLVRPLALFLTLVFGLSVLAGAPARAQDAPAPVYGITGTVQDYDGAAFPEVLVMLSRDDGAHVANDTTNASGGFEFTGLQAGDYIVEARHACCHPAFAKVAARGLDLQADAGLLILEPAQPVEGTPALLTGTVKDTATGSAVSLVQIEISSHFDTGEEDECEDADCAYIRPSGGYQYFYTETDAQGRFSIQINEGHAELTAYREGYDVTRGGFIMDGDRTLEVPLRPGDGDLATLHGILRSQDGTPLASGWVNVSPETRRSSECPPDADCAADAPQEEPVPEPPTTTSGGDPSWWHESRDQAYGWAQTGKDGSWEIQVRAGTHRVQGGAEDHVESWTTLTSTAGKRTAVNLTLERIPEDTVTITGRITDASTGEGIPYAEVNVENQRWGTWSWAQTDETGAYTIQTKHGYTVLTAHAWKWYSEPCGSKTSSSEDGMTVPGPACESRERDREYMTAVRSLDPAENASPTVDLALPSRPAPTSEFTGYVVNGTSQTAVPDARVTFYNEFTRDWGEATTDADGSYKIKVHPGYYTVRAWAEGYYDGALNVQIGDGDSERLDVTLTPGQKRYGYGHCCYAVESVSHDGASEAPAMGRAEGAGQDEVAAAGGPLPTEGQRVYEGAGGGLGPYKAQGTGGNAPAAGPLALVIVLGAVAVVAARRRD